MDTILGLHQAFTVDWINSVSEHKHTVGFFNVYKCSYENWFKNTIDFIVAVYQLRLSKWTDTTIVGKAMKHFGVKTVS